MGQVGENLLGGLREMDLFMPGQQQTLLLSVRKQDKLLPREKWPACKNKTMNFALLGA